MEIIKGKLASNADGSGLVKPVMPVPPTKTALDSAIAERNRLEIENAELNRQYNYHMANNDVRNADIVAKQLQPPVAAQLVAIRETIARLQAEYNTSYSQYETRISNYNRDFAVWAEATAKINNTDPALVKAQIEAEVSKTTNALKIAESSASSSSKKWIIIGVIIVAVIIAGVTAWYFIKKRKG